MSNLVIDNKDASAEYGVFVERDGLRQVVQMPAFKKLQQTEWPDEDGVEVDLTNPVLDSRTLQITFLATNIDYARELIVDLSDGAYHTFYFADLSRSYTLRLVKSGSYARQLRFGRFTLTFADDFPIPPTSQLGHFDTVDVIQRGYKLSGIDFSQMGVSVLKGSDDNIRKAADVKENLKISLANQHGVVYDPSAVHFKAKDVQLKLFIHTNSITEFWQRWETLFAYLVTPSIKRFYSHDTKTEYECYYKSNSVSKFNISNRGSVWCEFTVTLVFTSYRPTTQYQLLATENSDYVITQDGRLIPIRTKD